VDFIDSTGPHVLLTAAADASRDGWDFTITRPRFLDPVRAFL
jgi:hypothetical protein